ncbi:interphotoreceptor retinoid-binding protein [Flexivirga endophytica]|uniref:Interphotoreceptor retinoid-binding protein n=1 Tax=Flexivirga endophytica TaxID=1849103 RepID=A0A916T3G8_9MICO|nr:S41 family peptidase [Flexivirga endophytica]GGB28947.1 interphotoreceptor retinoid-binding protein [Flexivirga endophytica]GHB49989.1 interphotoreceptor retinoid-binding protein [Flexivirga endophytica]
MEITERDQQLIDDLRGKVRDRYILPERGTDIADKLAVDELPSASEQPAEFAAAATTALHDLSHDGHLRVRHRSTGAMDGFDGAAYREFYAREAVANAGGIRSVSRLDEMTGLMVVAPYLSPMPMAQPYVDAAFALLRGVERLVIDLRAGRGGTPETVACVCGFLLGDEPVHLQDVVTRDGTAQQFWTMPHFDRLPDDVSVAVLTSTLTFSGCEELAYNLQAQQRATIVGETTGGGAHPVEVFRLSDVLEVTVPIGRSVNAVTGTNWEGTGVVPDVPCAADEALSCWSSWRARWGEPYRDPRTLSP